MAEPTDTAREYAPHSRVPAPRIDLSNDFAASAAHD
jgi:hypothetical protein